MNTQRQQKSRNHRDEIAEVRNISEYFNAPFEERGDDRIQNETFIRFSELIKENKATNGALDDFSNHGPWRDQFMMFLRALEHQWEKQLLNPTPGAVFSPEYLAGGLKAIKTVIGKIVRDEAKAQEMSLLRQAEMEAHNVHNSATP